MELLYTREFDQEMLYRALWEGKIHVYYLIAKLPNCYLIIISLLDVMLNNYFALNCVFILKKTEEKTIHIEMFF